MAVIRKRLIFWLIKAYIKKSGKTFILFFLLGLLIFFALVFSSRYYSQLFPFANKQTIGLVGAYTQDTLPSEVVDKLSGGLTKVAEDGTIKPQLASSWEVKDGGKKYIFRLKPNQYFNNGKEVSSETINYDFADVTTEKPNKSTIIYTLKDAYSPFLVTVSRPVFDKGLAGIGEYKLEKVERNGNFIQSLTLISTKNRQQIITYEFYPTEEALKLAFLLGEVSQVNGLTNKTYKNVDFNVFPNVKVTHNADYTRLVTLFFNTTDPVISDKKVRFALSYALPEKFTEGIRSYVPYSPKSIYYNPDIEVRKLDINHAKLLLLSSEDNKINASSSGQTNIPSKIIIKTLKKYTEVAKKIAEAWKRIGINTTIEEVDEVPDNYQIFLGDFSLPRDPDQYTLWHSDQRNNITRFKNLRIDKLLEDGRKNVDLANRKKLYDDFQKYLNDDAPAAFLYFPTEYTIVRN